MNVLLLSNFEISLNEGQKIGGGKKMLIYEIKKKIL